VCRSGSRQRLGEALSKLGRLNRAPYLNRPIMKRKGGSTHLGVRLPPDPKHDVKLHRYAMFFAFLAPRMADFLAKLERQVRAPADRYFSTQKGVGWGAWSMDSRCLSHAPQHNGTPCERSAFTFEAVRDLMREWTGEAWTFVTYQVCIDLGYVRPDLFNESAYVFVGATGAVSGLSWLFKSYGGLSEVECCALLVRKQRQMWRRAGVSRSTLRQLFDGAASVAPCNLLF
jgi:hypothetical protein